MWNKIRSAQQAWINRLIEWYRVYGQVTKQRRCSAFTFALRKASDKSVGLIPAKDITKSILKVLFTLKTRQRVQIQPLTILKL